MMKVGRFESALFRPLDPVRATPQAVASFLGDVIASQSERPREMTVEIDMREADVKTGMVIDLERGEPVLRMAGESVRCKFAGKWLAAHDVPLPEDRHFRFRFTPVDGGRIRIGIL